MLVGLCSISAQCNIDGPPRIIPDVKGSYSGGRLQPYLPKLSDHLNLQLAQLPKILLTVACWYLSVDMTAASQKYDFSVGGWVSQIVIRDLLLICLIGGVWDWILRLSSFAERLTPYKFDSAMPNATQMRRDMFWSGCATLLVSAQEVLLMRWWASGSFRRALFSAAPSDEISIPWGEENPFFGTRESAIFSSPEFRFVGAFHFSSWTLCFLAWAATIQYWRSVHFFCVHRAIHPWWDRDNTLRQGDIGAVLYHYVHSHHHKSYNPTAWTGISMYPIESVLYLSACLVPLLFRSGCHPLLALYTKIILIIDAQLGHDGYDDPGRGTYFHQLHHSHFECNYGTQAVPLDWAFGLFEDGRRYVRSYTTGQQLHQSALSDEAGSQVLTMEEVAGHKSRNDCWIVLSGLVLNVTDFLSEHPGGEQVILSKAGTDVTKVFDVIHKKSGGMTLVKQLAPNAQVGVVLDQPKGKDSSDSATSEAVGLLLTAIGDAVTQGALNLAFAILCASSWELFMGSRW